MSDACWQVIPPVVCCADGGSALSGIYGGKTSTTYYDGNMTWQGGLIDGQEHLFHPCINLSMLTDGAMIDYQGVIVAYRTELGVVQAADQ